MNRALVAVLLLVCLVASAATRPAPPARFGIVRFVSPTGTAGNDGITTNSPWSLSYALSQAGSSTFITLLPGTYPSIEVSRPGTVIRSSVKWGARIVASAGSPGILTDSNVANVTIEGLEITGSTQQGVLFNGSNCVLRNCWVHDCAASGVSSRLNASTLIEENLIEHNGAASPGGPGIVLSGTNCIVRGNVIRYNQDWGCEFYATAPNSVAECDFYNNIVYGNGAGVTVWSPGAQTNYVFNNTIISLSNNCLIADFGTLFVTNNIMMVGGGHPVMWVADGATINSDYNLVNVSTSPPGPHDVLASDAGFVNPGSGLYWLTASSAARSAANSSVIPRVSFFAKAQTNVSDIGAVQYDGALAADTRVLDPSSSSGADYWAPLSAS